MENSEPAPGGTTGTDADSDAESAAWRCGLNDLGEHCDNPPPAPKPDEGGRRKGGKPALYCCKAHANRASVLRAKARAANTGVAVGDFAQAVDRLAPGLRAAAAEITELLDRATEIRDGLLTRVAEAERDADQARTQARAAEDAAKAADTRVRQALADARDATAAQKEAERDARRAAADAERAVHEASQEVAAHEHARGVAETERDLAVQAREEARTALTTATGQITKLDQDLIRTREDRDERATRLESALADLAAVRQELTAKDAAIGDLTGQAQRLRQEIESIQSQAAEEVRAARQAADARVASADTERQHAEQAAQAARHDAERARSALEAAQAAHAATLQVLERERDTARAEATEQRERAVAAEHDARALRAALPASEGDAS